ncbi:hypothetical protein HZS_5283 [Henneguya salminicola]|nr:hypothetical protein HZS_5283 [Henneguya salminicola]
MLAAVAFIEEDNVIDANKALDGDICLNGFEQQFRELLNYYESLSSEGIIVRTENGIRRTNNKVECWHNAFARLFGVNHPNI